MAAGRIVWRALVRAQITSPDEPRHDFKLRQALRLDDETIPRSHHQARPSGMARPDVFSVRRTSVEDCLQPMVHEIKVSALICCPTCAMPPSANLSVAVLRGFYVLPVGVAEPQRSQTLRRGCFTVGRLRIARAGLPGASCPRKPPPVRWRSPVHPGLARR
jgi:hypothetical protein